MRHLNMKSSAVIFFISFAAVTTVLTAGFSNAQIARAANPYIQNVYFGQDDNGNYISFDWVGIPKGYADPWWSCRMALVGVWFNRFNPDGVTDGMQLPKDYSMGDVMPQNSGYSGSGYGKFGQYGFASGYPRMGCASGYPDLSVTLPRHIKIYLNPNWSPEQLTFAASDFITIELLGINLNATSNAISFADPEKYSYQVPANPIPPIPYTNVQFGYDQNKKLQISFDWVGPLRGALVLAGFNGKITNPYYPRFIPDPAKDVSMIWENGTNQNLSNINWLGGFTFQKGQHYDLPVNELHRWTSPAGLWMCNWYYPCAVSKSTTETVLGRSFKPDDYITLSFTYDGNYVLNDPNKYFAPAVNHPPVLSFPADALYVNDGIDPNMGAANVTPFTFRVIYTDADNNPPSAVSVVITSESYPPSGVEGLHAMSVDATAPATLHDGNFANGEQYVYTSPFPNGVYNYHFETTDGSLSSFLPVNGQLLFISGYSSVAFLPGLEASRLYKPGTVIENQLWEPKWNADVQKLFMNPDGTPVNGDIYARGAMDKIYGVLDDIYSGFADSMQKLVTNKVMNEFEILPYDWRLQLDDVLSSGASLGLSGGQLNLSYTKPTTTPYIIQEVERLARNSATGKVTLVGHSNGGLLAKRLMKKLAQIGEANLVDKIILVAVPQTGTPSALAAVLHGYDQELLGGFVMSKATARTLAENMPSAYNLLPDAKYFSDVSTPVITFDPQSSITQHLRDVYGHDITNRDELRQFMLGADGRAKPAASDTDTPNVLNSALLNRARGIQDELDSWTPPAGVSVIQVAGWGASTLSAINYTEKDVSNKKVLDYAPQFVVDGDGTVVIPSALAMGNAEEEFYMNLPQYDKDYHLNRRHKDILELPPIQELIGNSIENKSAAVSYITSAIPLSTSTRLGFAVHSPVSLDLYDASGNHTGVSTSSNPYGDLKKIDEQIPNSYYMEFGEGKYAGADGTDGTTTVQLLGLGLGTFTFDISEMSGNTVVASTTFADIPVTASTTAVVSIEHLSSNSEPILALDLDGDGTADVTISAGDGVSTDELLGILRGLVKTLHLPLKKEQKLLKEIDKLTQVILRVTPEESHGDRDSSFPKGGGQRPEDLFREKDDDKSSVIAIRQQAEKQSHQKHRPSLALQTLQETVRQFLKKNLLTKDEADELVAILEQIRGIMVK